MNSLKQYDFNKPTGWASVLFVSIAFSLLVFASVYLFEGLGWLEAYKEELVSTYQRVGQNWVRGAGIAVVSSLILFFISTIMLRRNKKFESKRPILWNHLDFNNPKCTLALVLFAISFTFFANAAFYNYEYSMWALSGIASANSWYLEEASVWATAAMNMAIVGSILTAIAWILIVVGWKKARKPQ